VLLVRVEERGASLDSTARSAMRRRILEAALTRADVAHAAWVSSVPFGSGTTTLPLAVPGVDSVSRLGRFTYQVVSSDYFATIGTRIVRGRPFDASDRAGGVRVVIVSEAIARTLWPGQDALGQCMKFSWRSARPDTMPCHTVIGVAENALHDPAADLPLRYYLAEEQLGFAPPSLLLRLRRDPAEAAEDIRRTLQAILPGQSHVVVQPARDMVTAKRRSWQLGATMFVAFGVLALAVAAVGLYGVLSYDVTQRMHEMGVRIALGARREDVIGLIVRQGGRLASIGIVLGIIISLAGARWVQPLLFRQSAHDAWIHLGVAVVLLVVAATASAVPAMRAARANPAAALRAD
jgi:putative ABC transport system permease protein